ncbi:MAG: YhbY family RNA-binding protein [Pseudomonadota bacterium]|nr:YhbY family RNA-binding protein [Pseudomonadota bacterium]
MVTSKQKKKFRAIGHSLKPIVTVANETMSQSVNDEIDRALRDHELVKIKVLLNPRSLKKELVKEILKKQNANLIQLIGNVALVYRKAKEPKPELSNILRNTVC